MTPSRWLRTMPMVAVVVAALAAAAGGGCGDDPDPRPPSDNTGGTGGSGDGGTGGGEGGTGGTGGTGGAQPCEVDDDCQEFERCEDGTCVPKCRRDRDCGLNKGLRCDETTGRCVEGMPCDIDANCGEGYCNWRLRDCYCQEDQSMQQGDPPRHGVCWRKAKLCDLCELDTECGEDSRCVPYNYAGETMNVCLRKYTGSCPQGTIAYQGDDPDLIGLCVPQYEDCADFRPCSTDDDCDQLNPVCDKRRGICVPGCYFDFQDNKSQGCPPAKVCHMTADSVNPQLIGSCELGRRWGYGKCGNPCESDDECKAYGDGFVCAVYGSERRCVPAAAARREDTHGVRGCMSDEECEIGGQDTVYVGYCDLTKFECVEEGCRLGLDWRTGCNEPFEDCISTYKCAVDPDTGDPVTGICVEKDCIDLGGALRGGCLDGWFCNGERFVDPFTGEELDRQVQAPAGSGTQYGECFRMDASQWCISCGSSADCADMNVTGSDNPSVCVDVTGMGDTWCAPGCDYVQDCPAGWICDNIGEARCFNDPAQPAFKTCTDDGDCMSGPCVNPLTFGIRYQPQPNDAYPFKVCACDPSAADPCGSPELVCNAGIATVVDGEVQEHYCTKKNTLCGPGGSCEFFGDVLVDEFGRRTPTFSCANDGGVLPGVSASCPAGFQPGGDPQRLHKCWLSRVCVPRLVREGDNLTCGPVEPSN